MLTFYLRTAVRRPLLVLVVIGLLTVAACTQLGGIRLRLDGRSLVPESHPALAESDAAAVRFGGGGDIVVGIVSRSGNVFKHSSLTLLKRVGEEIGQLPGVRASSVRSLATVPHAAATNGVLDQRPLLSALTADPDSAHSIRRTVYQLGLNDGILVSPEGDAAAVYAELEPGVDRVRVTDAARDLVARVRGTDNDLLLSGSVIAQAELGRSTAADLRSLIPMVLLVLGAVIFVVYRHPFAWALALAEVGVSIVWTAGLMGATGQSVFVTTLVLPVILLCIGVSDDLQAIHWFFLEHARSPDRPTAVVVEDAFRHAVPAVATTSAATMFGLLSIAVVALTPQRTFGLWGAFAIGCSTVFTFTLVPAALVLGEKWVCSKGDAGRSRLRLTSALGRVLASLPRWVPVGVGVLLAVATAYVPAVRVEDSWLGNLAAQSDAARDAGEFDRRFAGMTRLEFLLDTGIAAGVDRSEAFARIGRFERHLAKQAGVGAVWGAHVTLVRVRAALDEQTVSRAGSDEDLVWGDDEIAQFGLLAAADRQSPLRELLDDEHRVARVVVFVRAGSYERIRALVRAAEEWRRAELPGEWKVTPFGDGWVSFVTVGLLVNGQVKSIVTGAGANYLVLLLAFRSWLLAAIALAPSVVALVGVMGFLGATGRPLGIANSMFVGVVLGIGLDYAIHLIATWRRCAAGRSQVDAVRAVVTTTGPAIVTTSLAVGAGVSVLLCSSVSPNAELGLLVVVGLMMSAWLTLILVPPLLRRLPDVPEEARP